MFGIIFGVFIVLHGLVHLLYSGQSRRVFELQPGMAWPDGSWLLSRFLGNELVRWVTAVSLILVTVGFVAGGIGIFLQQTWWRPVSVSVAVFSALLYILLWDGRWQDLADKGGVGVLINVALLTVVLLFNWPKLSF